MELDIKEGYGIGNREDWDDFVRDGEEEEEEEEEDFCRKNSSYSSTPNYMYWSRGHFLD